MDLKLALLLYGFFLNSGFIIWYKASPLIFSRAGSSVGVCSLLTTFQRSEAVSNRLRCYLLGCWVPSSLGRLIHRRAPHPAPCSLSTMRAPWLVAISLSPCQSASFSLTVFFEVRYSFPIQLKHFWRGETICQRFLSAGFIRYESTSGCEFWNPWKLLSEISVSFPRSSVLAICWDSVIKTRYRTQKPGPRNGNEASSVFHVKQQYERVHAAEKASSSPLLWLWPVYLTYPSYNGVGILPFILLHSLDLPSLELLWRMTGYELEIDFEGACLVREKTEA